MNYYLKVNLIYLSSPYLDNHNMLPTLLADISINLRDKAVEEDLPFATEAAEAGGAENIFTRFVERFLSIAMFLGALILLGNLVFGGVEWIMAGGDSGKIEKARNRMTQSVVGIIVLSASVAIFMVINDFLGNPLDITLA